MTRVDYSTTVFEAHMILGLLVSYGIEAVVANEGFVGALGETAIDLSTVPTMSVVDDSQAEKALRVLAERDATQRDEGAGEP